MSVQNELLNIEKKKKKKQLKRMREAISRGRNTTSHR